jgi:predicted  nucleic acid-binding Zn-ribbon protein
MPLISMFSHVVRRLPQRVTRPFTRPAAIPLWSYIMRRPPRRQASAGRSVGVAEHRFPTGLTRHRARQLIALACIAASVTLPTAAHAQSTEARLDATERSVESAAERWFDAQRDAAQLEQQVAELTREIARTEERVANARDVAARRALLMYQHASVGYASVFGSTALDTARRAELIDGANAQNVAAIDELEAALEELASRRDQLVRRQGRQRKALDAVAAERGALEEQLASLREQMQRERAAADRARRRAAARAGALAAAAVSPPASSGPAQPLPPPPPPPATTTVHPRHGDPFLVCTRARESGGNYAAVSPAGYYGAYQFLPATWDATAVHAGRSELVGVLPSRASAYDQDDLAWALYQWQGKQPWGGRC